MADRIVNLRGASPGQNRQTDAIARLADELARQVQATPFGGAAVPEWVLPQLLSGFTSVGAPYGPAGYHLDALGYVHLGGLVTTAAGTPAWTPIFELPPAVRPVTERWATAIDVAGVLGYVAVRPSGVVYAVSILGPGASMLLDGFSFLVGR